MITLEHRKNAHTIIDHIFQNLFPAHGMPERPAQTALCHRMLDAMLDSKIALCEAGTGIGKTYAYLVACFVLTQCRAWEGAAFQPVIISTSSIALQKAITSEYLPRLSRLLLEDGMIQEPLLAVVRKGKSHYVCDERLERRIRGANAERKNQRNLEALLSMREQLDLDGVRYLSSYDRKRICVPQVCECQQVTCRYLQFLERCKSRRYLFHICNHNLLLADAIHREREARPILPSTDALVIDEAHKLPEAARQMFGMTLSGDDFRSLIFSLKNEEYMLASQRLSDAARPLIRKLDRPPEENRSVQKYLALLAAPDKELCAIRRQLFRLVLPDTRKRLDRLGETVSSFQSNDGALVFYVTESEDNGTLLCASVADLSVRLQDTLWNRNLSTILTSGTMAVGSNFGRFRETIGLQGNAQLREFIFPSPYNYEKNCLLYLPKRPPHEERKKKNAYYNDLSALIVQLLNASHGHALILFTSYAALSGVMKRLEASELPYPLFSLERNSVQILEQFRATPGAVLLATGAAWEGMDFPGDCVSLLIIPKLPFAYPDARQEQERARYPSLSDFIRTVVVPDMQIKLRQGFGRAIRKETDTCVVAILDERAAPGQRYHAAMMGALPKMPVTDSLRQMALFFRNRKSEEYFDRNKQ